MLALGVEEVALGEVVQGVGPLQGGDEEARRTGNSSRSQQRAQRFARDVAKNDPSRLVQPPTDTSAAESAGRVHRGGRRNHGLGRREQRRPSHRAERAEQGGS